MRGAEDIALWIELRSTPSNSGNYRKTPNRGGALVALVAEVECIYEAQFMRSIAVEYLDRIIIVRKASLHRRIG